MTLVVEGQQIEPLESLPKQEKGFTELVRVLRTNRDKANYAYRQAASAYVHDAPGSKRAALLADGRRTALEEVIKLLESLVDGDIK